MLPVLMLLAGCGRGGHGHILDSIRSAIELDPVSAKNRLDTLDMRDCSPEERLTCDFLRVKATDKANMHHHSDSLILSVVDRCARDNDPRLPEALYLTGRVYLDLGDFTSSLRYYHKALDRLPPDTPDQTLRGTVLANIAYVLKSMYLPGEAISYLGEVVRTDSLTADSVNWVYDLELLADCRFTADSIGGARETMRRARELASARGMEDTVHEDVSLAYYALYLDGPEPALAALRRVSEATVPTVNLTGFYARAAEIYLDNDIPDSAALYAKKLIASDDYFNSRLGYLTMLSPKLRSIMPPDSLYRYLEGYNKHTEDYVNGVYDRSTLIQNSQYNYSLHERERIRAEQERDRMRLWLIAAISVACAALLFVGYRYFRSVYEEMRSRVMTEMIQRMILDLRLTDDVKHPALLPGNARLLLDAPLKTGIDAVMKYVATDTGIVGDIEEKRIIIRNKIIETLESLKGKVPVHTALRCGSSAERLRILLKEGRAIDENDSLWESVADEIRGVSPDYFRNLYFLCRGDVTRQELEAAMLIKMGIRPKDMETLLGRTKGAVSSRRITLSTKIFDKKTSLLTIDNLLRLL